MLLFYLLEFINSYYKLNFRYSMPGRKMLGNLLEREYDFLKASMKEILRTTRKVNLE